MSGVILGSQLQMLCLFCLQWVPEITHHCPKTPFLLVGTQIDLRDDPSTIEKLAKNKQKPITPETAEKLARDLKAVKYVECSALTQVRVGLRPFFACFYSMLFFSSREKQLGVDVKGCKLCFCYLQCSFLFACCSKAQRVGSGTKKISLCGLGLMWVMEEGVLTVFASVLEKNNR